MWAIEVGGQTKAGRHTRAADQSIRNEVVSRLGERAIVEKERGKRMVLWLTLFEFVARPIEKSQI